MLVDSYTPTTPGKETVKAPIQNHPEPHDGILSQN